MSWNDPTVILGLIGVGITTVYTLLTGFILKATQQNTTATRNIIEAAHRPYVDISDLDIEWQMGEDPRLSCELSNTGSVPAHVIAVEIEIKTPLGARSGGMSDETIRLALFPGHPFKLSTALSTEEKPYVQGTPGLEASLIVRYQGVTNQEYTTQGKYACKDDRGRLRLICGSFS